MNLTSVLHAGILLCLGCGSLFAQNETTVSEGNHPASVESASGLYTTVLPDGLFTSGMDDRRNGVLGMGAAPAGGAGKVERRSSAWQPTDTANAWYYGTPTQNGVIESGTAGRAVVQQTNSVAPPGTQTLINTQTNVPTGRYAPDTATVQPGPGAASGSGTATNATGAPPAK